MKLRTLVALAGIAVVAACGESSNPLAVSNQSIAEMGKGRGHGKGPRGGDGVLLPTPQYDQCRKRIYLVQVDLDAIADVQVDAEGNVSLGEGNRIGGGNQLQTYEGLTSKLTGATTHLNQDKPASAYGGLTNFRDKVISMLDELKMELADAEQLLTGDGVAVADDGATIYDEGVNGALNCVGTFLDLLGGSI